jgi:uncharacterized protein (TIRG00374 family)
MRDADLREIGHALGRSNPWFIFPLLASLALFFWLKAIRWRMLLSPLLTTTTAQVLPALMVGYASNIVLPAQLGEFVRMYIGGRQFGINNVSVLATIVLERIFDFLAVLFFLALPLLFDARTPPTLLATGYVIGGIAVTLLITTLIYMFWSTQVVGFFRSVTRFLPAAVQTRLLSQLELGATALQSIRTPRLIPGIVITSLAQWGFMGLCTYTAIAALGLDVPLSAGFVVLAITVAGLTLPNSPGFFGTIQLCFTLGLAPYGVNAADAIAASIFYHVLFYLSVALAGLYFLRRLGYRFRDIKSVAASTTSGPVREQP